eukprot:Opistho-2@65919
MAGSGTGSGTHVEWMNQSFAGDAWGGERLGAALSAAAIEEVRQVFRMLRPSLKMKVLLSFLSVRKSDAPLFKDAMEDILQQAARDDDEWVRMVHEVIRSFARTGEIGLSDGAEVQSQGLRSALEEASKALDAGAPSFAPLEWVYLADDVVAAIGGTPSQKAASSLESIHFRTKEGHVPAAAALRARITSQKPVSVKDRRASVAGGSHAPGDVKKPPSRVAGTMPSLRPDQERSPIVRRPSVQTPGSALQKSKAKVIDIAEMPNIDAHGKRRDTAADRKRPAESTADHSAKRQRTSALPDAPTPDVHSAPAEPGDDGDAPSHAAADVEGKDDHVPPPVVPSIEAPPSSGDHHDATTTATTVTSMADAAVAGTVVETEEKEDERLARQALEAALALVTDSQLLSVSDKEEALAFLRSVLKERNEKGGVKTLAVKEETTVDESGVSIFDQTCIQLDYSTGTWRRFKRRKKAKTAAADQTQ